jgi:hypothetical protein
MESLLKRYKEPKKRPRWEPVYRTLLAEAERLSRPAALYEEFSLADVPELSPWLPAGTSGVVLAVCTLGPQVEDHLKELANSDMVSAVILDEIILALVTALTRQIHTSLRSEVQPHGLKAGAAYRPGVGRWPLETQRTVFAHLPAHNIGVTLDEYLWMAPSKSTSLIIPLLNRKPNPAT